MGNAKKNDTLEQSFLMNLPKKSVFFEKIEHHTILRDIK